MTDFKKQILTSIDLIAKTQDHFFFFFLFIFSFITYLFENNGRLSYPQRIVEVIHYLYSKDGFTYDHSIQLQKCFLFVFMYIDLLKLKAYKLFENNDADLSWLLF